MPKPERVLGWDVGGAHLKASRVEGGRLVDVAQWPCPLWQGPGPLQHALAAARERWPDLDSASHAITMTGEMVDRYPHREAGVADLARSLAQSLHGPLRFFAGAQGWCGVDAVGTHWPAIASANWLASAELAARAVGDGVLVDIGSSTTDLIALRGGRPVPRGRNDAERLASGELVYQGVVRTPLCALGPRVPFGGAMVNVMNEFFATTADVYRLSGGLAPEHDQQPSADGAAKVAAATRQRLARMVGRDACDATDADWLALAQAWRAAQLTELRINLDRVLAAAALPAAAPLVAAGCGDFLAEALAGSLGRPCRGFAALVLGDGVPSGLARWAQVAAPSVAVALLAAAEPA